MKKSTKKYIRVVDRLVRDVLKPHSFQFGVPKELARVIQMSDLPGKQRKAVLRFAKHCRAALDDAQSVVAKKWSVCDHSATTLEWLPLPAPDVDVTCRETVVRYETVILLGKSCLLLSLKKAALSEKGVGIAGINLSDKELRLVSKVRNLTGRCVLRHPIHINRCVDSAKNIVRTTAAVHRPDEARLSEAIRSMPQPILFGILHAVLATIMPLLEEGCKPFYLPAIRLNDKNQTVRNMQLNTLRSVLGGFSFGRDRHSSPLLLPEIAIQDKSSLRTLEQVTGIPVLAYLDRDAMQRALTDAMQRAHCEVIATGFAQHPLQTLPLLTGTALPAENSIFAFDWPTFEAVEPQDVTVVRTAFAAMLQQLPVVVDALNSRIGNLALDGRRYAEAYFLASAHVFDAFLFRDPRCFGTLFQQAEAMVSTVHDQEAERLHRFDAAIDLLGDIASDHALIADSAAQLRSNGGLGFWYENNSHERKAAFDLNEDFPVLLEAKLGLRASDSEAFRQYLRQRGYISELSKNVRGRKGTPCTHVLIALE